jgi:hypothetical protein
MEGWRKLHNEELHNSYSSPSVLRIFKLRRIRWVGHVLRMVEKRNANRLPTGKPEGRRPLGIPRSWWESKSKIDFVDVGLGGLDWIGLAQDRYKWRALGSTVMNLQIP